MTKTFKLSEPCVRHEDGSLHRAWLLRGGFVNLNIVGEFVQYSFPIMKFSRRDWRGTKPRVMYGRIVSRTDEQIEFQPVTKKELPADCTFTTN